MDQEVKEASLATIAVLVACFGDVLKESLKDCFPILVQRLTNEITRMSALRAITRIANSPLRVDLVHTFVLILCLSLGRSFMLWWLFALQSPILEVCVKELCTFLRKDSQALRHETALTLEALVSSLSCDCCRAALRTRVLTPDWLPRGSRSCRFAATAGG